VNVAAPPLLPDPGALPSLKLGDLNDERLPNGVRVVVVRRSQVPLVQLRLRIPLGDMRSRDGATLRLLPKMLLAGTRTRSGSEMAAAIQGIGASVHTSADVDHLSLAASAPAKRLPELLRLLTDMVENPAFQSNEVAGERERVAQEVLQEAADPVAAATRALNAELFPGHLYADPLPSIASVQRTGRSALSHFHEARVRPAGSTLVVVGEVDPEGAVEAARSVLGAWPRGDSRGTDNPLAVPRAAKGHDGIVVIPRPGAVQSNLRIGMRCAGREAPAFPAMLLAVTTFGGSFTSRIVTNLRERNGYTYAPRAGIDERHLATALTVHADVATEVTAKALVELRYELARMATAEITHEELESSRRYVIGTIAMAAATQAELADTLAGVVTKGLDPSYLQSFVQELTELDVAAVSEEAARSLGPVGMTTVVVGDATVVTDSLSPLDVVKVGP